VPCRHPARARHVTDTSYGVLVRSAEVHDLVAACVEKLNARLNPWETTENLILADADFTVASGELTPSLKARAVVAERYDERIARLYRSVSVRMVDLDHLTDDELSEELAG